MMMFRDGGSRRASAEDDIVQGGSAVLFGVGIGLQVDSVFTQKCRRNWMVIVK